MNSDITDMDPLLSGLFVDRHLIYTMYDALVRVNAKGDIVPGLGDAATIQFATLLQSQLAKADITMDIKTLLFNDIVKLQQDHKHLGMTLIGWSGRTDPDGNVYDFNYTGRPNNDSAYSNKDVDKLLDDSRTATDNAKRRELLLKAQQIFAA